MKKLLTFLSAFFLSYASFAVMPIFGELGACVGWNTHLFDSTAGGTWSSSNPGVATIGSSSGIATGISSGTSTITYTVGASYVTAVFAVNPVPAAIVGGGDFCVSSTITLTDATSGGTWVSEETASATIGSTTGVVTGVTAGGVSNIYYYVNPGCYAYTRVYPEVTSIYPITGPTVVCPGSTITLTDTTSAGGVWSSSNPLVATVSTAGFYTETITGISSGTAVISFTTTGICGALTTTYTITVSPTTTAGTISGSSIVSAGATTTLSDGISGGTWSSSNVSVATVGAFTGIVTGIATGTATITYTVTGCSGTAYTTFVITVPAIALGPIVGTMSGCVGTPSYLYIADSGGVWTSSNPAVASISAVDGEVSPLSAGTTTITYSFGGSYVTAVFTVYPTPAAITGVSSLCVGATSIFTDATTGGTWSSDDTYIATAGATTGVVTGSHDGTVDIIYTLPGGCAASAAVLVGPAAAGYVSGDSTLCSGFTTTFTASVAGGVWSSSNVAIATVGASTGVVTGVSAGTVYITYTVTGACGSAYNIALVTVSNTTDAGVISGSSTVYVSMGDYLSETVSGGTWSSSNPSIATVDTWGNVTGISAGTATITYSVTGCGGTATTTFVVTVVPLNNISGNVLFSGGYSGWVKVWLITYNAGTTDLEAYDSTQVYCSGDSVAYQFLGEPTDSFRIKASVNNDSFYTATGFIPTYHTSSFYWHDATVLYHVAGTSDTYQDINMATGVITPGPGFISGNVLTGANRGTSGSVPAVGLLMEAESTTGSLVQQTYTDASGNYSFSNLALGTYQVHPEALNYYSTDYTSVSLTAASSSMRAANFIQHTKSHTITPVATEVPVVKSNASSVVTYPNPTNGALNIKWQETATENGAVTISDITGREIYKTTINMTEGTGVNQIDLSGLTSGLYIISVKSGDINYNSKIQVMH